MLEDYLKRVDFKEITKNTIMSVAELRRQLSTVRRDRIAYSLEEFTPGIIGMAMPILSAADEPLGSINIAMPAVRYNSKVRDRVAQVLEQAVDTIRQQLGFIEPSSRKKRRKSA